MKKRVAKRYKNVAKLSLKTIKRLCKPITNRIYVIGFLIANYAKSTFRRAHQELEPIKMLL